MSNISPFLFRLFRPSFVGTKNPPSPRGKVRAFGAKESDKLKFAIYSVIISLYKENFQHFVKKLRIYKFSLCIKRKRCIIIAE